jgi:integrase
MRQLSLFERETEPYARRQVLDAKSEQLIQDFGKQRLLQGASRQSVLREISQLRSIARECGVPGPPLPIEAVFTDVALIARVLREPSAPISRATGRARLLAAQRFLRIMGPMLGRDAEAELAALDALLPARRSASWHSTGTLVAGEIGRRRPKGPTLDAADLYRIVDAAGESSGDERKLRDRALVAIQCFSGIRIEELIRLRWKDVEIDNSDVGYYGFTASVERSGCQLRLPLLGLSGKAFGELQRRMTIAGIPPSGPVFRAGGPAGRPLSYRGARKVLVQACTRAGLPPASSAELRAGCAHWLRSQGLSDHEVTAVLGLARVRTVDRLLSRHAALDAQRRVREQLEG